MVREEHFFAAMRHRLEMEHPQWQENLPALIEAWEEDIQSATRPSHDAKLWLDQNEAMSYVNLLRLRRTALTLHLLVFSRRESVAKSAETTGPVDTSFTSLVSALRGRATLDQATRQVSTEEPILLAMHVALKAVGEAFTAYEKGSLPLVAVFQQGGTLNNVMTYDNMRLLTQIPNGKLLRSTAYACG